MGSGFSVFEYLYRDASNYKVWGRLLLSGVVSQESIFRLRGCLDSGDFFVAEQVGVPVLYRVLLELSGGQTDQDHAYHEFFDLRSATKEEVESLSLWGAAAQLLDYFSEACGRWDCTLSPLCYAPYIISEKLDATI